MTTSDAEYLDLDLSTSLCAPAVRMVAVHAWAWSDDTGQGVYHALLPVVALRSVVTRRYERMVRDGRRLAGCLWEDEGQLGKRGWLVEGQSQATEALVVGPDGSLESTYDLDRSVNTATELACCPWPPDEDEERLAETIQQVREEAVRRAGLNHATK